MQGAGVKCPFVHLSKDDRRPSPKRSPKGEDPSAMARQIKQGKLSALVSRRRNPSAPRGKKNQKSSSLPIAAGMKVANVQDANPGRGVLQKPF